MGEKYTPVKGDRVRVVLEGEVTWTHRDAGFEVANENTFHPDFEHVVSIEKVEPPVEVFKPGDTVRARAYRSLVYSLGSGGYYAHAAAEWRASDEGYHKAFTSERYEKVDLG